MMTAAVPDGLTEITRCEVCGSSRLHSVIDLGMHPMCDDLVAVGTDRVCTEYPIEILFCETCRTAHQRFQVPKQLLFPRTYHYRSRQTRDVLDGMRRLVEACERRLGGLAGKRVLDIGCNDGSLLSIFAERGAKTFGIEPTGAAEDARGAGHAVSQDYLTEALAAEIVDRFGRPALITFTNVFAHIEDLGAVIRALRILCDGSTCVVIENHYLGAILARRQFDTFYHEHPRTYSLTSFTFIADALGKPIAQVEFPSRYGGNIRVFLGGKPADVSAARQHEASFGEGLARLARDIAHWRAAKSAQITSLVGRHGPLPGKAFPGRAAIPIRLLQLDSGAIDAVHEKPGSPKIGHYIPGTRIPIRSDGAFASATTGPIVNMAWHIAEEIGAYLRGRGYGGEIIDIIAASDFTQ